MENDKKCTWCKEHKPLTEFREDKRMFSGLRSHCIECDRLKGREHRREFYQNNKDKVKKQNLEWKKNNKEKTKEQAVRARAKLRLDVLNHYSNGLIKCSCCGEAEIKFLCIDHIENNGSEERKKLKSGKTGYGFYSRLRRNNFPTGYQVLCHNCNMAKGFYGECPHRLH